MAFIFATGLLVRASLWCAGGLDWSDHLYNFARDDLLLPLPKQPMGKNTDLRGISTPETSVSQGMEI